MQKQYQFVRDCYQQHPKTADELLQVGAYPSHKRLDKIETAALAIVVNTIINFDEAYMKRQAAYGAPHSNRICLKLDQTFKLSH